MRKEGSILFAGICKVKIDGDEILSSPNLFK